MTVELHNEDTLEITFDAQVSALVLQWKEATRTMGQEGFRAGMLKFAIAAHEQKAEALIVDTREFHHKMSDDTAAWRKEEIIPKYNAGGAKRFAFILPAGSKLPPDQPAVEGGPLYVTRFFDDEGAARDWATEQIPQHITVQYTLSPDASLDEVRSKIQSFVANIAANHPGIEYTSQHSLGDERKFIHVIRCENRKVLQQLQATDFFKAFGPVLAGYCAVKPQVTRYRVVASTR